MFAYAASIFAATAVGIIGVAAHLANDRFWSPGSLAVMLFVIAAVAALAPILDPSLLQSEAERLLRAQMEEKRNAGDDDALQLSMPEGPKRLKTGTQRTRKIAREAEDQRTVLPDCLRHRRSGSRSEGHQGTHSQQPGHQAPDIKHWWNYIPGLYLVTTALDPDDITERLGQICGEASLLVIRVDPEDSQGWLPEKSWNWIKRREGERSAVGVKSA